MDKPTVSTAMRSARPAPAESAEAPDFSAGEALAEAARAWLSQLPAFAGVALVLHLPLLIFAFVPLPGPLLVTVFLAAEMGVALLVKAALVKAVIDGQRQLPTEPLEYFEALRKAPAVLDLGARILARAAVRGVMFVMPGLNYLCDMFAAVPAVIVEGGPARKVLQRSEQLTRGVGVPLFGICAVIWSVAVVITLVSGVLESTNLERMTWMLFYFCARALDRSFAAVLSAITYHRLRASADY